jgi:hypothetical protein
LLSVTKNFQMPRMNGGEAKIEIFNPFGDAYTLTKKILFEPFDFKKWLVMGFAAFLSGNSGGIGFRGFNADAFKAGHRGVQPPHLPHFGTGQTAAIIAVAVVVILVLILVITWVVCRGRFVFADCVVKNRAAIAEPWREFRREGNSYFLFSLAIGFGSTLIFGALALLLFLPGFVAHGRVHFGVGSGIALGGIILLWLLFAIFLGTVFLFMVPVMYRQRCSALKAFPQVSRLFFQHLGAFILLILFGIVLALALIVIGAIVTCATCCIGGLPYVNSVLLLPIFVCFLSFRFFFLRQFGNEFDVWNGVSPLETPPPPPLPALQA